MTSAPKITKASTSIFGPFVSKEGKDGLLKYQYNGQDNSILAPIMYPYWRLFHRLVPDRWSPNVVTLLGLAVVAFTTLWANLSPASSSIKCIALAIAINLYQTADAVDGLQGRKVGMYQNPTTEMFDHGVDSAIVSLTSTSLIQFVLEADNPLLVVVVFLAAFIGFHSPTYEHLITGKMIFRGGPTNPTETLCIAQVLLILAGIFPSVFHGPIGHLGALTSSLAASLSLFSSIKELYVHYNKDLNKTIHSAIRGYSPLFLVIITCALWLPFNGKFYSQHSILCLLTIAIPWNYCIFRTIINEITGLKGLDTMSVLKGQSPALIPVIAYFTGIPLVIACGVSLTLSVAIYLYTIRVSLREVCDALDMKSWYSIRDERLVNKKQ